MDEEQLKQEFHKAMLGIYYKALDFPKPYRATRFFQMVNELGGKRQLINY